MPESARILNERSLQYVFLLPAALTLWNRWKNTIRKCAKTISIGNIPDSRPNGRAGRHRGRPRGRRRQAGSGGRIGGQDGPAESEGRTGRSNRMGSGCQAQWRTGRRTGPHTGGRPAAGRNAKEAERSRTVPRLFFRLLLFGGRRPAAWRSGRISGVDRLHIEYKKRTVKRKIRKSVNFLGSVRAGAAVGPSGCNNDIAARLCAIERDSISGV